MFIPFYDLTNYPCPPHPYFGESSSAGGNVNTSGSSGSPTSEPFVVKFLNGRIKVCEDPHLKNSDNGLLSPPLDICICHKEPLSFINPNSGLECSKLGNAYYHVKMECIRKKHPTFSPMQIDCSNT